MFRRSAVIKDELQTHLGRIVEEVELRSAAAAVAVAEAPPDTAAPSDSEGT